MSVRNGLALFTLLSIVLLAPGIVSAQSATSDAGQTMRTPDGQPDISGIFTFRTLTPLERPEALAGQPVGSAPCCGCAASSSSSQQRLI